MAGRSVEELWCRTCLKRLSSFLSGYEWILDSFIIEFFVERHWNRLPISWRETFSDLDDEQLKECGRLLLGGGSSVPTKRVYPLSFLSLAVACRLFESPCTLAEKSDPIVTPQVESDPIVAPQVESDPIVAPQVESDPIVTPQVESDPIVEPQVDVVAPQMVDGLSHLFRRHVKPKKQHEIIQLGKVVNELCQATQCRNVIDVGSGQGHLTRYLAFHFGLDVTAVEAVRGHLTAAAKFDREVERDIEKKCERGGTHCCCSVKKGSVRHIEAMIQPNVSTDEFLSQVDSDGHFVADKRFVLTGLHTCGDLAPSMLRLFSESERVVGLASVGCCYMKMAADDGLSLAGMGRGEKRGCGSGGGGRSIFMSKFLREELQETGDGGGSYCPSYQARELACHSIAAYRDKLQATDELKSLKVHCCRAAVEIVLRKSGLKRAQVRIAKRVSKMPFKLYARKLLESVSDLLSAPPSSCPPDPSSHPLSPDCPLSEPSSCPPDPSSHPLSPGRLPNSTSLLSAPLLSELSCSPSPSSQPLSSNHLLPDPTYLAAKPIWSEAELDQLNFLVEEEWRKVVLYFVLRLVLAPCVETMILLDRKLFLLEQGYQNVSLIQIFNSKLSPRNTVLLAR